MVYIKNHPIFKLTEDVHMLGFNTYLTWTTFVEGMTSIRPIFHVKDITVIINAPDIPKMLPVIDKFYLSVNMYICK